MNTKTVLTASAIFLGIIGIVLSFLPSEIISHLNIDIHPILTIIMQLLGALYLGFGILNWMAKGSIIGGIYNKPIVIGNLMHFGVGTLALVKIAFGIKETMEVIIPLAIIYIIFALLFSYIFMVNPNKIKNQ